MFLKYSCNVLFIVNIFLRGCFMFLWFVDVFSPFSFFVFLIYFFVVVSFFELFFYNSKKNTCPTSLMCGKHYVSLADVLLFLLQNLFFSVSLTYQIFLCLGKVQKRNKQKNISKTVHKHVEIPEIIKIKIIMCCNLSFCLLLLLLCLVSYE